MTWDDVREFLIPAMMNLYKEDRAVLALQLEKSLGFKGYDLLCTGDYSQKPISKDEQKIYKLLADPHGRTILRAYQIKHGLPITELKTDEEV